MNNETSTLTLWNKVEALIQSWRGRRNELIHCLQEISFPRQLNARHNQDPQFQTFCQKLVDYVSTGHFEIYLQLVEEGREFADGGLELASNIYQKIESSTDYALSFNDKYDAVYCPPYADESLPRDLSKLNKVLAIRFELEDQFIEILHSSHKNQVA